MSKPKVIVIVGPTASGKTSLSIDIAQKFDGEVISADSRQVYRGLDIGTEKVSAEEMRGVPHHLLDVVDPSFVYTAADFKRDAAAAIDEINRRGCLPIIAGGTFFYIDTLLERISLPAVPPNEKLRTELERLDTTELHTRLKELDPTRAASIEPDNKRRLMRAIEVAEALGAVPPPETNECPFEILMLGIETDKAVLRTRLRTRAEAALKRGLVAETEALLSAGVSKERLSEIGLEYRLVIDFLDGVVSEVELIQKLEEKNWQYAKRQLTWLKRDDSIVWVKPGDREAIFRHVATFLTS